MEDWCRQKIRNGPITSNFANIALQNLPLRDVTGGYALGLTLIGMREQPLYLYHVIASLVCI